MPESYQDTLKRVRPPRVRIDYKVETEGGGADPRTAVRGGRHGRSVRHAEGSQPAHQAAEVRADRPRHVLGRDGPRRAAGRLPRAEQGRRQVRRIAQRRTASSRRWTTSIRHGSPSRSRCSTNCSRCARNSPSCSARWRGTTPSRRCSATSSATPRRSRHSWTRSPRTAARTEGVTWCHQAHPRSRGGPSPRSFPTQRVPPDGR